MKKFCFLSVCLLVLTVAGCSRKTAVPTTSPVHDTLWRKHYEVDTAYVDRWHYIDRTGDTMWLHDSVVVYKARFIHDTVRKVEERAVEMPVEVVREVERPLTFGQQLLIRMGWLAVAAVFLFLIYIAYRIWRRK